MSPRQGALGTSTGVEVAAPRGEAGTLALRESHRHTAHRSSIFSQARQTLDKLETQYAEEELARAEERARLDEAWALLHERVESCRRQDAAARAAREEAMRFAKETRDSVKQEAAETMEELDATREALKAETASKRQEIAAAEQKFVMDSKVVDDSLKELRERLDARGEQLTQCEAELTRREGELSP